jgi:hypothetical protein
VGRDRHTLYSFGLYFRGHRFKVGDLSTADDNVGAGVGKGKSAGASDAAASAGYQSNLSFKRKHGEIHYPFLSYGYFIKQDSTPLKVSQMLLSGHCRDQMEAGFSLDMLCSLSEKNCSLVFRNTRARQKE